MPYVDFLAPLHTATQRDYLWRVRDFDKAALAEVSCRFGYEYWDGPRQYGYGGYRYDGRWRPVAEALARHYGLRPGDRVLDVGCGKGYLLYELTQAVPGLEVAGCDISEYAIKHGKEEIRDRLWVADAGTVEGWSQPGRITRGWYHLVLSINALHNLTFDALRVALAGMEGARLPPSETASLSRPGAAYLAVDGYRNEREKANLLHWQLTMQQLHTPAGWSAIFDLCGYTGDWSCIYYA